MSADLKNFPAALTIAGSDSGGGAGIQADLKTFSVLGVYGCSVITGLTAQNTVGVHAVELTSAEMVRAQMQAVLSDIQPAAAKTGMLGSAEIIEAVCAELDAFEFRTLVVDPVMISKHGHRLLDADAEQTLRHKLLPRSHLVTPNLPEAAALAGVDEPTNLDEMEDVARRLVNAGARNVLVKGGHLAGDELVDLFYDGSTFEPFYGERIDTPHTHGTGCTLSAAIAAGLARGLELVEAVVQARAYLTEAIHRAFLVGKGIGPVNHLWMLPQNGAAGDDAAE
jgi:hydroxymethylpyrimidine/phosphomethylpyrimidine kinase